MDAIPDHERAAAPSGDAARNSDSNNPAGVRPDGRNANWTPECKPLTAAAVAKVWKKRSRQGSLEAGGTSRAFEKGRAVLYCDGRDERFFDEGDDAAPNENPPAAEWEAGKDVLRRMAAIVVAEADHSTDKPSLMKFYQSSVIFLNTLEIPPFDVSPRKIAKDLGISHDTVYERRQRFQDRLHDAGAPFTPPPEGARMGGADDAADRNRNRRQRGSGRPPKSGGATPAEICGRWGLEACALTAALMRAGGDDGKPVAIRTAWRRIEVAIEARVVEKRGELYFATGEAPTAMADAKTNE